MMIANPKTNVIASIAFCVSACVSTANTLSPSSNDSDGRAGLPDAGAARLEPSCSSTPECRGGEFCDRGVCAMVQTHDEWGHGYGAQCVGEEFYPERYREGQGIQRHCRGFVCVDGHCSSCTSDEECHEGEVCSVAPVHPSYPESEPAFPGRRCIASEELSTPRAPCDTPENPVPCGSVKSELPEPTLVPNVAQECSRIADCRGDEFCDRGQCAPVLVNEFGHGYGAAFIRREPSNVLDTCLGYLSIGRSCSSCLADSECFPEAPYCVRHPSRPEGHSCAEYPEESYYDALGDVAPAFADFDAAALDAWVQQYRAFLEYHAQYRDARRAAGLPVPPPPPPLSKSLGQ